MAGNAAGHALTLAAGHDAPAVPQIAAFDPGYPLPT